MFVSQAAGTNEKGVIGGALNWVLIEDFIASSYV